MRIRSKSAYNCKARDGHTLSDRSIPDELLLEQSSFPLPRFNKCKQLAGLK